MTTNPPTHLSSAGKKLFVRIASEIELDEPALLLLTTLCEQYDRMNQARELLKKEGIVVKDRFGQDKQHPAVGIEVNAAAGMMRAWRLLGFDQEPPKAMGRPEGS